MSEVLVGRRDHRVRMSEIFPITQTISRLRYQHRRLKRRQGSITVIHVLPYRAGNPFNQFSARTLEGNEINFLPIYVTPYLSSRETTVIYLFK